MYPKRRRTSRYGRKPYRSKYGSRSTRRGSSRRRRSTRSRRRTSFGPPKIGYRM